MASQAAKNQVLSVFDLLGLARPSSARLDEIAGRLEREETSLARIRDGLIGFIADQNGMTYGQAVELVIGQMFARHGVSAATPNETATMRIRRLAREFAEGRGLNDINQSIRQFASTSSPSGTPQTAPQVDDPSTTPAPESDPPPTETRDFFEEARALFDGVPTHLIRVFAAEWERTGNVQLALAAMRADPRYDQFFVGNRRADGTFRLSEADYVGRIHGFRAALQGVGLNPDLFQSHFGDLIEGDVTAGMLEQRLLRVQEAIVQGLEEVRQWYTSNYGIELTDEAILASVLDPQVGQNILERRISMAEVGAEGAMRGFEIGADFADRLVAGGLAQPGARQFFAQAESRLPTLGTLAQRFRDRDDQFRLEDFAEASLFGDAFQRRRIGRLSAAELASFTGTQDMFRTDRETVTGLRAR